MARHSINRKRYLEVVQLFHWAYQDDYGHWFHGEELEKIGKRDRRTEYLMPEFEAKGKLRVAWHNGKKIYSAPRRLKGLTKEDINPELFPHGVACTDCLVRFHRADVGGKVISEKEFHGFGRKPEWGILFPSGTLLLLEFCTNDNFKRKKVLRNKVSTYIKILPEIVDKFGAERGIVLFVCDAERTAVEREVGLLRYASPDGDRFPLLPFFFVDYETFQSVELGKQLTEKIYIWAVDGRKEGLR